MLIDDGFREFCFEKENEKFLFRYRKNSELELLDSFAECAAKKENNFDLFDASVLGYKITEALYQRSSQLVHKNCPRKHA